MEVLFHFRREPPRPSGLLFVFAAASLVACHAETKPTPANDGVDIWIAGDVHLGAARTPFPSDFGSYGIVNLEGPIGEGADQSDETRLVNAPESATVLKRANVVIAGIANNHSQDLGPTGTDATIAALEAAGIQPIAGARVGLIKAKGLTIAVTAHDLSKGIPETLEAELKRARASADALIATFHVFAPHGYLPPQELKEAVAIALRAKATVIAAHGTHHLARVNRIKSSVVAYGLGNLAFACACGASDEGLILKVRLSKQGIESAEVLTLSPGDAELPPHPSSSADVEFDLLESLGSNKLSRNGPRASF